ncbi:MAG: ABC transporter permease, partial [Verrucomicrobiales bacterium]
MFRLNPLTRKKLRRFREIRRGYVSFLIFTALFVISFKGVGEYLVNSRALVVRYEGKFYFPTHSAFHPGADFGLDYQYETNYRELKARSAQEGESGWVLLAPVPYNPFENDIREGECGPQEPSFARRH